MNITGKELYYAIMNGAQQIIQIKSHLNQINVFPVADGDTSTNLSYTMGTIIDRSEQHDSASDTLKTISKSAIHGARGNSGIIMAQYINGLYESIGLAHTLTNSDFIRMFSAGYYSAYRSVAEPVEGSILTVMKVFASSLNKSGSTHKALNLALQEALDAAQTALANTKGQLKVLREHNVVDSGASGFVAFIKGVSEYFLGGCQAIEVKALQMPELSPHQHIQSGRPSHYRYCFELLVALQKPIEEAIVHSYGDSAVIAQNDELMKIHIHTDTPEALIDYVYEHGQVLEQKIDDMKWQQRIISNPQSTIAIITDSIADLPKAILYSEHIAVIPLCVTVGGNDYIDRLTLSTQAFYEKTDMASQFSKSGTPKIPDIERQFQFISDHFEKGIVITVANKLSGTHQLVKTILAEHNHFNMDLRIIDSKLNSGAQGLLVLEAARLVRQGYKLDVIETALLDRIKRTSIFVSVTDFSYMVRGGRVHPIKGQVANLLNIKPIVSLNKEGKGIAFSATFTQKQNIRKILAIAGRKQREKGILEYCIVHGDSRSLAEDIGEKLTQQLELAPAYIEDISSVVAISAGRGAVAVAFVTKE